MSFTKKLSDYIKSNKIIGLEIADKLLKRIIAYVEIFVEFRDDII